MLPLSQREGVAFLGQLSSVEFNRIRRREFFSFFREEAYF